MYAGTFETRVFERVLVKEELFQRVRAGQQVVTGAQHLLHAAHAPVAAESTCLA